MPTLLVGNFILVEKFAYVLKDYFIQTKFKFPKDLSVDFLKSVICIPGNKIIYYPKQKELRIYPNCSSSNCVRVLPMVYSFLKESKWDLF
ncbi:S26 family signal peptidase [Arsenophonus endosymbiont of Aleurodicus dispersus]|uniref:S26 family signal peptidase n=1 Tax=Arsenophonus endosymbiont of Aleurodicus dispersus TaxID=235559 RepID=UPI000EB2CCBE